MRSKNQRRDPWKRRIYSKFCFCYTEPSHVNEMAINAPAVSPGTGNIQETETSIRESGSLNYEEARALLGRYEYQKGNIEAALHVFEGIDVSSVTVKLKIALSRLVHSEPFNDYSSSPLSANAAGLLFEAFYLKAKSLQALGKYREAAQSCSVIMDIVESSLPEGFPRHFAAIKLQETLSKAVELLPELWKFADSPREVVLSFRRALLQKWNLDSKTVAKIEKDFAIFLLYSEPEFVPPNLKSQIESAFVPKNNIEEALLHLTLLLMKMALKQIDWDPSILDHLSYVLSISGGLQALANQVKELPPGVLDEKENDHMLALCYHGAACDYESFDLWKKILRTQPKNIQAVLFVTKICAGSFKYADEGIKYARLAIENSGSDCDELIATAQLMIGMSYSASSRAALTESEREFRQSEAIKCLELAAEKTQMKDAVTLYQLSLEYADQRKLDAALDRTRMLVKLEGGSNIESMILLARILSAQKCYSDAENIINEVLDQVAAWDKAALLRTKAKLQFAQGLHKEAFATYSRLLAIIQVQRRNSGSETVHEDNRNNINNLELAMWHDLSMIYKNCSKWSDAETCISKLSGISTSSALRWHAAGSLHEAKGQFKEAITAYHLALAVDHDHVPSLVSMATALRTEGCRSPAIVQSFLTEALRLDRMNASAWYNLGLLYKDGERGSSVRAAECFQTSAFLQETEPIEPFR